MTDIVDPMDDLIKAEGGAASGSGNIDDPMDDLIKRKTGDELMRDWFAAQKEAGGKGTVEAPSPYRLWKGDPYEPPPQAHKPSGEELVRAGLSGVGLLAGTGVGALTSPITGWIGPIAGGAVGFDLGEQTTDQLFGRRPFWKPYTPNAANMFKGAKYTMGGKAVEPFINRWATQGLGRAIAPEGGYIDRGINWLIKRVTPEDMAADTLSKSTGTLSQFGAEAAKTAELEKSIPGFKASAGAATGDPGLLKLQRGLEQQPGTAAQTRLENQISNLDAIDRYLKNTFPDEGGGLATFREELARQKSVLEQAKEAQVGPVQTARGATPSVEPQEAGRGIERAIETARVPAKTAVDVQYAAIPNRQFTPEALRPLEEAVGRVEAEFRPGEESVYPKSSVDRINRAMRGEPAGEEATGLLSAQGRPVMGQTPAQPPETGFQDLHSLRKDIGRQISDASRGPFPNWPLVRRLQQLKSGIDQSLDIGMAGDESYTTAKSAYRDYAQKFRTGEVGDILQQGKEISGRKLAYGEMPKRIFTPDGADDFIRAVGPDTARPLAAGHAAKDLEATVLNKSTGELKSEAFDKWLFKNRVVLDKYGITDRFESIGNAQKALDTAMAAEKGFNKSILGDVLGADPDKGLDAAFGKYQKNTARAATELMDATAGNAEARSGLKAAYKDFLIKQSRTSLETLQGQRVMSPAQMTKAMEKYDPATEIILSDEPEKITALQNVRKAVELEGRVSRPVVTGGPDTAANIGIAGQVAEKAARWGLEQIPGVRWVAKISRAAGEITAKMDAEQANRLLVRALYDPDFAKILMDAKSMKISDAYFKNKVQEVMKISDAYFKNKVQEAVSPEVVGGAMGAAGAESGKSKNKPAPPGPSGRGKEQPKLKEPAPTPDEPLPATRPNTILDDTQG